MDLWVFIHSKFSQRCQQLIEIISGNQLDIPFTMLCIDDKNMRNRIINNKDIKVQYVPCILQINQITGVVSQYEADKAFELIYSIIESLRPEPEPEPEPEPPMRRTIIQADDPPVRRHNIQEEDENETIVVKQAHTLIEDLKPEPEPEPTAIKKRVKAGDVMAQAAKDNPNISIPSYNSAGIDISSGPPPPIKSVMSGSPINISEVMARANAGKD